MTFAARSINDDDGSARPSAGTPFFTKVEKKFSPHFGYVSLFPLMFGYTKQLHQMLTTCAYTDGDIDDL